MYQEDRFRWGVNCGWEVKEESVGSVWITIMDETARWIFHKTVTEEKRPLNGNELQVMKHLCDMKEGSDLM